MSELLAPLKLGWGANAPIGLAALRMMCAGIDANATMFAAPDFLVEIDAPASITILAEVLLHIQGYATGIAVFLWRPHNPLRSKDQMFRISAFGGTTK